MTAKNRYLVLDNALDRFMLPEGRFTARFIGQPADTYWAAGGQFPASLAPYRGVLLSGSEAAVPVEQDWYAAERAIVAECLQRDIPLLGICFGAQFMADMLWGREVVSLMPAPEIGWVVLRHDGDNPLFADVPPQMVAWACHYWGFQAEVPSLARSNAWDQQAFQVPDCRAWGLQFHPEVEWLYGSLRNQWERWHHRGIRLQNGGRPTAAACRQIAANFHRLAR
jgi:GMP synthase-like glutamine amidotransferase